MTNQDLNLSGSSILLNSNIGLWAIEMQDDHKPKMFANDVTYEILMADKDLSPQELYDYWYAKISADYFVQVANGFKKMANGIRSEIQIQWNHPFYGLLWFRFNGVINNEYKKVTRIEGTCQDVTDLRHEEIESESILQKNTSVMENLSSEFSSVFYLDLETQELTPYVLKNEFKPIFSQFIKEGYRYTQIVNHFTDRFVYEPDKYEFLSTCKIENIRSILSTKKSFNYIFQNNNRNFCEIKFAKIGNVKNPSFIALGFANKDNYIKTDLKKQSIIHAFTYNYDLITYIDVETMKDDEFAIDQDFLRKFQNWNKSVSYTERMEILRDTIVYPEDRNAFTKATTKEKLFFELKKNLFYTINFRAISENKPLYYQLKFVLENLGGAHIICGLYSIDSEIQQQLEIQNKLEQNLQIIDVLASEYSSVYYVDLETDTFITYTMNEDTENELGLFLRSGINYSQAFRLYVETLIYAPDRKLMLKAGSIENIINELTSNKSFVTTYRSNNNGNPHYCEMKFVKVGNETGKPKAVALGFADKDKEKRQLIEDEEIAERNRAVITGLSDDYGCVVYVDLDSGEEIHYRFDPFFEKHIPGWSKNNIFSKRLKSLSETLIHPDDKSNFDEATKEENVRKEIIQNRVYYVNFRIIIDNQIYYYQVKFVKDDNSDNHVIAGFHSVDDETKRELAALKKAEEASKAKSTFLFNMSHDIRTPMNAIMGFTDLAIKHIDDKEKALENLKKTKSSSEHLLSLINDILDMSRIESGKVELEEKPIDISNIADDILPMLTDLADRKNQKFSFKINKITDRFVYLDYLRMNQILINLVSNSVKYTDEGGKISLSIFQDGRNESGNAIFVFKVKDNGLGMSKEFQKIAFDTFSREKSSTISKKQGTGLGLAITKKIIDMMNGTITLQSKVGKGSTFTIRIPLKIQKEKEQTQTLKKTQNKAVVNLKDKRILLVDDNDFNREISTEILSDQGIIVETAVNGAAAVELVQKKDLKNFDAILMDIQMPVMNGYDATKLIRKLYPDNHIPIIALSANAFEEDKKKSKEAGMDYHLLKPIQVDNLFDCLRKFL